jgi:hypothetical protein
VKVTGTARPTTVNTPATSPLFEKNLDGEGVGSKLVSGDWICIVYVTHVLDNAFWTGELVGKAESVEGAVDVVSAGIEVVRW